MNQRKKRERITDAERKEAYKEAGKFVTGGVVVTILTIGGAYLYYLAIKKF